MQKSSNELAPYLFHQGTNYEAYRYLGFHAEQENYAFRVWAPNARSVALTGDFTDWKDALPMTRITEGGIWEIILPADALTPGDRYKYRITAADGRILLKSDPYARSFELPPDTASRCCLPEEYVWQDAAWMRRRKIPLNSPLNIYEIHPGSWKRHEDGSVYTYTQLADELIPYLKQMGYTHAELMPIMEHPFDGSWGYQVCGYFAPTSRYGSPREFMAFVDAFHSAGLGVILDWVPAHFPKDAHGLYEFDGQPLYEYQGWDRMEQASWGTRKFDVARNEVECFLISNALYWVREFHIDGLRMDAVASMLYLDYERRPGEWIPNVHGDNRSLEAIAFFQKLNSQLEKFYPSVMRIAEESSAFSGITTFENGGLGFTHKWNMGWMNDTLSYAQEEPQHRRYHHEKMTFPMMYAFNERYILPISHDEVVHGKKSFLDRMTGDYWQKFASARTFLLWQMTLPGKKLTFMGSEIGQFREWAYKEQVEWFLLDYDMHAAFQLFVGELNHFYLEHPPLWQNDDSWEGFQWIDADNRQQSILSYRRIDHKGKELMVILNFTPTAYEQYRIGVPFAGTYQELFNSDSEEFGGSGVTNTGRLISEALPWHGLDHSLELRIPPLGGVILHCQRRKKATERSHSSQHK